jgi:NAD(P)-dependent dehydrogenase (short-subunit alcohol dehydrogenase family)
MDIWQRHILARKKKCSKKLSKVQPLGRMGQSSEIASLALFLASDEAAFITGATI